jgi:hypothetical protein
LDEAAVLTGNTQYPTPSSSVQSRQEIDVGKQASQTLTSPARSRTSKISGGVLFDESQAPCHAVRGSQAGSQWLDAISKERVKVSSTD